MYVSLAVCCLLHLLKVQFFMDLSNIKATERSQEAPKTAGWWGFMCRPHYSDTKTTSPHHRYRVEINWRKRLLEIWKHASFGTILLLFPYSCTRFPFWKQRRLICSITVWRSSQWYWRYSTNDLKVSLAGKCESLVLQPDTRASRLIKTDLSIIAWRPKHAACLFALKVV